MLYWIYRLLIRWDVSQPAQDHVCEEFTQWTACSDTMQVVTAGGKPLPVEHQYEASYFWQERRCTICGWIDQEPLKYDSYLYDEDDGDA